MSLRQKSCERPGWRSDCPAPPDRGNRTISKAGARAPLRAMNSSEEAKVQPKRRVQFAFTDEQEQFRSSIRRFLNDRSPTTEVRRLMGTAEGYDPAMWRQMSEDLGLP